ncbi:hypothetical protein BDQ94DRAFT_147030 [Aspergillus welwitschiae]|uniref:Uncharacterized protein n=1 Tax=Aspergillus welwitschiae TaxID=1341132 RepID=A0A3F3PX92_9EURO|nr:hypothetical protein BDQ94DRAFT_147030 [Aspergillus welwitschiae]RDH31590.1 hypothetical protein BDQ94DRAFT_147030 [Aspergillus welwitschiae]
MGEREGGKERKGKRNDETRSKARNQLRERDHRRACSSPCVCQVRSNPMPSHPSSAEQFESVCLPARSGHHAARSVIGLPPGGIRRHPPLSVDVVGVAVAARGMRCMVGLDGHCSDSAHPPGAVSEDGGPCWSGNPCVMMMVRGEGV